MDLDVWACPVCLSGLREHGGRLACSAEARDFEAPRGLARLLRPEDESMLEDAERYARAWKREAWAPPPGDASKLPYIGGAAWKQKARSLEALLRELGRGEGRRVADAGAGTGWLSYRLAAAGFRCYAMDLLEDGQVGLGAPDASGSGPPPFERAIATLTRWPLRSASMDVAICNASLHYLSDIRPAIAEASRVLAPSGVFVAMNDPVHRDPESAKRASEVVRARLREGGGSGRVVEGHRHLLALELEASLREGFSEVRRVDPEYGVRFRWERAAKARVMRKEFASFPLYLARFPKAR